MSDTPKTDAAAEAWAREFDPHYKVVPVEFARDMERELNSLNDFPPETRRFLRANGFTDINQMSNMERLFAMFAASQEVAPRPHGDCERALRMLLSSCERLQFDMGGTEVTKNCTGLIDKWDKGHPTIFYLERNMRLAESVLGKDKRGP